MEWLRKLIRNAPKTEGGEIDVEALVEQASKEMPKYAVPKEVYNAAKKERDEAKTALAEAEKVDVAALQSELSAERAGREKDRKESAFLSAAIKAGASDPDYLLYRYGVDNIKLGKDGRGLADEEGLIGSLKETYASQFSSGEVSGASPVTITDQSPVPSVFTAEQLRGMSPDEINANWDTIQKSI